MRRLQFNPAWSMIMDRAVKAIYRNGTFILQNPCNLPEGSEVELWVRSPSIIPPKIADIDARKKFLKRLVERMQKNPIPADAPQLTREMLHER